MKNIPPLKFNPPKINFHQINSDFNQYIHKQSGQQTDQESFSEYFSSSKLPSIHDQHQLQQSKSKLTIRRTSPDNQSFYNNKIKTKTSLASQNLSVHSKTQQQSTDNLRTSKFMRQSQNVSYKRLNQYDMCEKDLTPEEWIQKCRSTNSSHGKVKFFQDNQYKWVDASVENYDENTQRYQVKIEQNGVIKTKSVNRLAIKFKWEDQNEFDKRIDKAVSFYTEQENVKKYQEIVQQQKVVIAPMNHQIKDKIERKLINLRKKESKKDQPKFYFERFLNIFGKQSAASQKDEQKLANELANQIKKACYIEIENMWSYFNKKSMLQNIQNYLIHPPVELAQLKGIVQRNSHLLSKHVIFKSKPIQILTNIHSRISRLNELALLNIYLKNVDLPLNLNQYNSLQEEFIASSFKIINNDLISYVSGEIQELHQFFDFFVFNPQLINQGLRQLSRRVDFQVREVLLEILNNTIKNLLSEIQNKCNLNQNSKINIFPLLIISIVVNKKQPNTKERKNVELLQLEPKLNDIQNTFTNLITNIATKYNEFTQMLSTILVMLKINPIPLISPYKNPSSLMADIFIQISEQYNEVVKFFYTFKEFYYLGEKQFQQQIKQTFEKKEIKISSIEELMNKLLISKQELDFMVNKFVVKGIFHIDITSAKEFLLEKIREFTEIIQQKVTDQITLEIQYIESMYKDAIQQLKVFPKNEEELLKLRNFYNNRTQYFDNLLVHSQYINSLIDLQTHYYFPQNEKLNKERFHLFTYPEEIMTELIETRRIIQICEAKLMDKLELEKENFQREFVELTDEFYQVKKIKDIQNVKKITVIIQSLMEKFQKSLQKINQFNQREQMFKISQSSYSEFHYLLKEFEPFHQFWDLTMDFDIQQQEWLHSPFMRLNSQHIEKKIQNHYQTILNRLQKQLSDEPEALENIRDFNIEIDKFMQHKWIIENLTIEALVRRQQHWKDLLKEINVPEVSINDELTLMTLIELKFENYRPQIEAFSQRIEKQWSLEKKIGEITEKLKEAKLDLQEYKQTFILRGLEDVQQLLDEQLNLILMMKQSQYIKPLQNKANGVENRIVLIQDTLDGWIKCQRAWMYLEPVFNNDDIKQKMALEKNKFDSVDRNWKLLMEYFNKEPHIWENIENDKYKNEFEQNNKVLEAIQKTLSEYLESKRKYFPKFYFLPDDELLEIISSTKDPVAIQKQINKCFEGVNQLVFENTRIVAVATKYQEQMQLISYIDINQDDKKGNIEKWLIELQSQIQQSLRNKIQEYLQITEEKELEYNKYPQQLILLVDIIKWTIQTEQKIQANNLNQHLNKSINSLNKIVEEIRETKSPLKKIVLSSLILARVHQNNIVKALTSVPNLTITQFEWISILRFYFQPFDCNIVSSLLNSSINYGFEFIGTNHRLVQTPLTDRCFTTLLSAYQQYYGVTLQGPTGTGKTETIKDLAKLFGVTSLVFNCSESLNIQSMNKFFKGFVQTGAWSCLDEYNKIPIDVLSVIAQQILTIFNALKSKLKKFDFEGCSIGIVSTCVINITMNTQTQNDNIPDNFKILFRPCSMMIADLKCIAETLLHSYGFQKANILAYKIVQCLNMSQQLLLNEEHYDFGSRALKSILKRARIQIDLKLQKEEDIVAQSIIMEVISKLNSRDQIVFNQILKTLEISSNEIQINEILNNKINEVLSETKLEIINSLVNKCLQLYDLICSRHGIIIIGQAFSGKSTIISTLAKSFTKLQNTEDFKLTNILRLNPISITLEQLYGQQDQESKQWVDGLLPILLRDATHDKNLNKWLVFDSPVQPYWIEMMNTVLDDNKKLCLSSGEIIKINSSITFLFETHSLAEASPSTISRCGVLLMENDVIGYQPIIRQYIQSNILKEKEKEILEIFNLIFVWLKKNLVITDNEMIITKNVINILDSQIKQSNKHTQESMDTIVLYSFIYVIPYFLNVQQKNHFNLLIKSIVTNQSMLSIGLPNLIYQFQINKKILENISLLDTYYCIQTNSFLKWTQTPEEPIDQSIGYNEIIIPSNEQLRVLHFLKWAIDNSYHILLAGPSSSGKTSIINRQLRQLQNPDITNLTILFSGTTNSNQIQALIETKMTTRKRKGVFAPEEDDLSMPLMSKNKDQSALELIRQWHDDKGWYDLETKEFKYIQDIIFINGITENQQRNIVSHRYLRHYFCVDLAILEEDSVKQIFNMIIKQIAIQKSFSSDFQLDFKKIVDSTILLLNKIQNEKQFKTSPNKSHYHFSIRDISKIFLGISKINSLKSQTDLVKLWIHESKRVLMDKMISEDHQQLFSSYLKQCITQYWPTLNNNKQINIQTILFCDFLNSENEYQEIKDLNQLKNIVELIRDENPSLGQLNNFVMFNFALINVVKICRIFKQLQGHLILVGLGGTGRKSLARISSFITFQSDANIIDSKNWSDEMIKIIRISGIESKQALMLIEEAQNLPDSYFDDLSNLINTGDIPSIFINEVKAKIVGEIQLNTTKQLSINDKHQMLIQKSIQNLHLALCTQPTSKFMEQLRLFPSLIKSTSILWFLTWPQEALLQTAKQHLKQNQLISEEKIGILEQISVKIHDIISKFNLKFKQEHQFVYYLTPSAFVEFLDSLQLIFNQKYTKIQNQISKYKTGVEKIESTEKEVLAIKQLHVNLIPQLEKITIQNSLLLHDLMYRKQDADQNKAICIKEEQEYVEQRQNAENIKKSTQKELDSCLNQLKEALEALENLSKEDMTQLKSFVNPPQSVVSVIEGLFLVFQEDQLIKGKNGANPNPTEIWEYAKKNTLNEKLLKRLKEYKIDQIKAIPAKQISLLKQFIQNPILEKQNVLKASKAAANLIQWIRAVTLTSEVLQVIEPKKIELTQAEQILTETESNLKEKQDALKKALDIIQELEEQYQQANKIKKNLQEEVDQCYQQLLKSELLIQGLEMEKKIWNQNIQNQKNQVSTLLGDTILASLHLIYLAVFPYEYRVEIIQIVQQELKQLNISYHQQFILPNFLHSNEQIQISINQFKLPNDSFSIINSLITANSQKICLFIDPQGLANQWIRSQETINTLVLLRSAMSKVETINKIELALINGYSLILENEVEYIDNIFDTLIDSYLISSTQNKKINFNDKIIEIHPKFKFYITTKLSKPQYSSQICIKLTIINFKLTPDGLQDYLLNIIIKIEEPHKEEQKNNNFKDYLNNTNKLKLTEEKILKLLFDSNGEVLKDEKLIEALRQSKNDQFDIHERINKLEKDKENFLNLKKNFKDLAKKACSLLFAVFDLHHIKSCYEWSCDYLISLVEKAIKEVSHTRDQKLKKMNERLQIVIYSSICRCLFEEDKLIFSLLICIRCLISDQKASWSDVQLFLSSYDLKQLQKNKQFQSLSSIQDTQFNNLLNALNPLEIEWPNQIQLNNFQKLIILKVLAPQKMIQFIQFLVNIELGKQFLEFSSLSFEQAYKETDNLTPIICLTNYGTDPRFEIQNFMEKIGIKSYLINYSLGKSKDMTIYQGIKQAVVNGDWIFIQNCHITSQYMSDLQQTYEQLVTQTDLSKDFRLILTTQVFTEFPKMILQKGVKIIFESGKGIKKKLITCFSSIDQISFNEMNQEKKRLVISLCFLHSILQERNKYGDIGWNVPYIFSLADFQFSFKYLINQNDLISLRYSLSKINYGGKIQDEIDQRLLDELVNGFFSSQFVDNNNQQKFQFCQDQNYYISNHQIDYDKQLQYFKSLPLNDSYYLFSINQEVDILQGTQESENFCQKIVDILPKSLHHAISDYQIIDQCQSILDSLQIYNLQDILNSPIIINSQYYITLEQSAMKFINLINIIKESLNIVIQYKQGLITSTQDIEDISQQIFHNVFPKIWTNFSYSNSNYLSGFIKDFKNKLDYFNQWAVQEPTCIWLESFFSTNSFFCNYLMDYSIKNQIPFDQFNNINTDLGIRVNGIYLQGASFSQKNQLEDSNKQFENLNDVTISPCITQKILKNVQYYDCPLLRVQKGVKKNHQKLKEKFNKQTIYFKLQTNKSSDHWTKRGVTLFTQLFEQ